MNINITQIIDLHWNRSKWIHWLMHKWMTGWLDEIRNVCVSLFATLTPENTCHTQAHTGHQIRLVAKQHSDSPHCCTRNFPSLNSCTQDGTQSNLLVFCNFPQMVWSGVFPLWSENHTTIIWYECLTCPKMLWSWVTSKETQKLKFSNIFKPQRTWKHDNMACHNLFPIWQEHEHYIKKQKQKPAGLRGFVSTLWHWSPSFRSFDVRIEHSLQQRKSDVPLTAPLVAQEGEVGGAIMWILTNTKKMAPQSISRSSLSMYVEKNQYTDLYIKKQYIDIVYSVERPRENTSGDWRQHQHAMAKTDDCASLWLN